MPLPLREPSRVTILAFSLSASAIGGCGGPSVADITGREVSLTLEGIASAPEIAAIGEPAEGGLGVTRAVLRAGAVRFEACQKDVEELALAPRAYELAGDPPPSERVTTAVQELCGVQIDVEATGSNRAEAVPDAATLYVEVSDESGESSILTSEAALSLRFETEAASSFGEQPLLLGVDVSTWLADVPLDADVSEQLAQQLRSSAALYIDANGNGALDDDERTPLAASQP